MKIVFLINPISGTHRKDTLPEMISQHLDSAKWQAEVRFTEYAGHARVLAAEYAGMGYDAVVAVGGDGTVNEVATGLRDTPTALGIIPIGSGNGFARHLHLPLKPIEAIRHLNTAAIQRVDYGLVDAEADGEIEAVCRPFFCTCGTGFDAYIADRFAKAGKRGLPTYVQEIVHSALTYKAQTYHLINAKGATENLETSETSETKTLSALLITFANANQWGNAAEIAPHASLTDGLMDIVVMDEHARIAAPDLALRLYTHRMDQSHFITTMRASSLTLERPAPGPFHIDGDPLTLGRTIHLRIIPLGLHVLA